MPPRRLWKLPWKQVRENPRCCSLPLNTRAVPVFGLHQPSYGKLLNAFGDFFDIFPVQELVISD